MKIALGIDTSNYTSSAAACDENGNIIASSRRLLAVKEGERGLRQSHALFQHIVNLPEMIDKVMAEVRKKYPDKQELELAVIAASSRPRPVEGSYMPVFLAGTGTGRSLASSMGIPYYEFSHQEGHIAAVCGACDHDREFLSFHLSGGTGEILRVKGTMPLSIAGGTRDISFGQLLDRVGVAAGLQFPAGAELDRMASSGSDRLDISFSRRGRLVIKDAMLRPIHTDGPWADLSGTETKAAELIASGIPTEDIAPELFMHISEALVRMVTQAAENEGLDHIVFAGGVSASDFIRSELHKRLPRKGIRVSFGSPELSSDNACGTARLGMDALLHGRTPLQPGPGQMP